MVLWFTLVVTISRWYWIPKGRGRRRRTVCRASETGFAGGKATQLALVIGREGSLIGIVHRYNDIFNDTGTLHALSEHAVTNQSQLLGPRGRRLSH